MFTNVLNCEIVLGWHRIYVSETSMEVMLNRMKTGPMSPPVQKSHLTIHYVYIKISLKKF